MRTWRDHAKAISNCPICTGVTYKARGVELLKAFADWYEGAMPDPQGEITEVYTVARRVLESMGEI